MPSKTGKNGLNFVRADDENGLISKDQPDEVIEFFKVIYILLKEPYEDIPNNKIIVNLKTIIFPKYNVDSFSKYFVYKFIILIFKIFYRNSNFKLYN